MTGCSKPVDRTLEHPDLFGHDIPRSLEPKANVVGDGGHRPHVPAGAALVNEPLSRMSKWISPHA